jgi:hypothetical protein
MMQNDSNLIQPIASLDGQDPELVALKLRELDLRRQRARLVKENGLAFYRPHRKQDLFHAAGGYKRRAVFAGNRFGKSDCGASEDVAQAVGERLWYPKGDIRRTVGIPNRPQKILIITTDWGKVDEIFTSERGAQQGKLWRLFPSGFVKSKKRNHSGAIETIECVNGSLLQFDTVESYKKNPQGAESSDWDVIHVDEPCPQPMYNAHARGLMDRDGSAYFTLTPLKEPWIYDYFYGDEVDAQTNFGKADASIQGADRWSITGSIWDNPYLTEDAINRYLETLDDEERACRESGIPLQFAGLIYKEFGNDHLYRQLPLNWTDYNKPPRDYSIYYHIDPHPQTPVAVLFTAVAPSGRKYLFEELFIRGLVKDITDRIKEITHDRFVVRARVDPIAFNEDELTGKCWANDFELHNVFLTRAVKSLERGIPAARAALKSRMPDGSPEWLVSPKLSRFIYEIKRYHWDKDNKPVDKDDHMMENFYRTVLDEPVYIERDDSPSVPFEDKGLPENPLADEVWNDCSNLFTD